RGKCRMRSGSSTGPVSERCRSRRSTKSLPRDGRAGSMKITADTHVLLCAVLRDDARQRSLAVAQLSAAEAVAFTLPALCEFVWVLRRGYKRSRAETAEAIRLLIDDDKALLDRPAVEAGLAQLEAGGDFADGAIAYEGG